MITHRIENPFVGYNQCSAAGLWVYARYSGEVEWHVKYMSNII